MHCNEPGGSKVNLFKGAAVVAAVACAAQAVPAAAQQFDTLVPVSAPVTGNVREHGCLTEAIYREAGAEPMKGRMAVAQVIMNRTRSGIFPSTVCGVIHQRGQFTFPKGLGPRKGPGEARLWAEARSIASLALRGALNGLSERAVFFHAVSARNTIKRTSLVAVIGRHAFYAQR